MADLDTRSLKEPAQSIEEQTASFGSGGKKPEHCHRYFFSLQFCLEKVVLDIASGEGDGSALLGTAAQKVVGVDRSPEVVGRASRNYGNGRVAFTVGEYTAIPLADASVDVVVSFETLEHVADRKKFLGEIKRVLRPDGTLVISTPNATADKDLATELTSSADHELDATELRGALGVHFSNCQVFSQRSVVSSAIAPDPSEADREQPFSIADGCAYPVVPEIGPPTCLIAVASEVTLPQIKHGVVGDRPILTSLHEFIQERAIALLKLEHEMQVAATIRERLQQKLRRHESALIEVRSQASKLQGEVRSRDDELRQLCSELRLLENEKNQLRSEVTSIYGSGSWKLTRPFRFLWRITQAFSRLGTRLFGIFKFGRLFGPPAAGNSVVPPAYSTGTETELQVLERSGLFDARFYLDTNPDVTVAEISALEHFLRFGAFEGRRPNRLFDSAYYLTTYPDVAKAGVNPVLHYFLSGAFEGRDPSAEFDTSFYLEANPEVATSGINPLVHFLRFGTKEGRLPLPPQRDELDLQKLRRLAAARQREPKLTYRPLLSVILQTDNSRPAYLETAVQSVIAQAYPNWELRIVEDVSCDSATLEANKRIRSWDERIFVVCDRQKRGIAAIKNDALQDSRGEYVAFLSQGDELTFDALYEVVLALNADRTIDVIYTDQDYLSPEGKPAGQLFKPDWSPTLFRGVMYIEHLLTVRRSLALEAGGFNSSFDLVQDFEFMLRVSERMRHIRHIPKVHYHQRRIRGNRGEDSRAAGNLEQLQAAAVQAQLERLRLDGCARPHPRHPRRVVVEAGRHSRSASFDLFIHGPAASKTAAMGVESALAQAAKQVGRAVLPAAWSEIGVARVSAAHLTCYQADRGVSEAVRLSRFLREGSADFVLALSADIAIDTEDWLELLMLAAQERDVAVACPALLSADGLIAQAGLVLARDATARPAMRGSEPGSDGYAGSLSCAHEISAASAEVVLLRRTLLARFLRPDPVFVTADFLVADLTLRATRSGLRALCLPYVRARRLATAEADSDHRLDALLYQDIWNGQAIGDPFYNPNFLHSGADYS